MKGLSPHYLARYRQISLPCRVFLPAVKLETASRGWGVRFSPAHGAVSALSPAFLRPRGHPRSQVRPAGSAGQGRAGQGRAGKGRGPRRAPGKALPCALREGGPGFPSSDKFSPRFCGGFWCDTVLTCCNWFPHPPRLRATGSTCEEPCAALTRRGRDRRSWVPHRAGKRRSPPAGQRRSKWLSVRLPPGPARPLAPLGPGPLWQRRCGGPGGGRRPSGTAPPGGGAGAALRSAEVPPSPVGRFCPPRGGRRCHTCGVPKAGACPSTWRCPRRTVLLEKWTSSLKSGGVGTLAVLFLYLVLLLVFAWIWCKRWYSCLLPPGVSK